MNDKYSTKGKKCHALFEWPLGTWLYEKPC